MTHGDGNAGKAYAALLDELREQARLEAALMLLEWDQDTMLPRGAFASRAQQVGTLSALLHERQTAPAFLDRIDRLADDVARLPPDAAVDVRELKWRLDRRRALSPALVRERSVLHSRARAVWANAHRDDDFEALAPYLEQVFRLEREVARTIDSGRDAYDVLLEDYEPGVTRAALEAMLGELREGLLPLVERVRARLDDRPLDDSALCGDFPAAAQRRAFRELVEAIGFDFTHGRLDESAHPFTITIGEEVRLTTRYDETDLRHGLFPTIHEAGHGLYEQGLVRDLRATPRGTACSAGIHESQARLWENLVARSRGFWCYWQPRLQKHLPALSGRPLDEVLLAASAARPSWSRVEADEVTYNLHVILRVELECALLDGALAVRDLPGAWRELAARYVGVVPSTNREGVLQDVHWAAGDIGYFPTYTLGNVYAAQLWRSAAEEIGDLDELMERGEYVALLEWLRHNVHRHGQRLRPQALIAEATGEAPAPAALLAHLDGRVRFLEEA